MNWKLALLWFWATASLACAQVEPLPPFSVVVQPASDRMQAGDSLVLEAWVKDEQGDEYPAEGRCLRWDVSDMDSLQGVLVPDTGRRVTLTTTWAHGTLTVSCSYMPAGSLNIRVWNEVDIEVVPAAPYRVHLELDTLTAPLRTAASPDTMRIAGPDSTADIYGIIRDKYENYIGVAQEASWVLMEEGVVSLTSPVERQGEALIVGLDTGVCAVTVGAPGLAGDTVTIVVGEQSTVVQLPTFSRDRRSPRAQEVGAVYHISGRRVSTMKVGMNSGLLITSKSGQAMRAVRTSGKEAWSVTR